MCPSVLIQKPSLQCFTIRFFIISFQFLTMALQEIQLSIAYAVWTGIGTLGAAVVGILFFQEPKNAFRIICIVGIMGTIIGLKVVS